jgi:hypothetical protein
MTRQALLALLGAAGLLAALALVLGLGARPVGGGVDPGPSAWTGAAPPRSAASATEPAPAVATPIADGREAQVRAAAALVAGPGGGLIEAPSGLAGRDAAKRGSSPLVPWERVAVVGRVSELGALARPLARGLAAARQRMGACYAEERRALAAGEGPAFDPADPPTGPAVLVLDLETRAGGVRVVSANVDSLGTSTEGLAMCAVQLLSGYDVEAPGAAAGKRFRLLHPLH